MQLAPINSLKQNIQMTGGEKKKRSFLGTIGSSIKDIGLSAAAGTAIGVAVGGTASLIPVKNTEGIKGELEDAFLSAVRNNNRDSYIRNASTKDQFKKAKNVVAAEDAMNKIISNKSLKSAKKALKAAGNDEGAINKAILQIFDEYKVEDFGVKLPSEDALKDVKKAKKELLKQFDSLIDNSVDTSKKAVSSIQNKAVKFIEEFNKSVVKYMEKAPKNDELMRLAKKEAKRVRRDSLISNAVWVGILSMLLMNLFNTFIPKKKAASNPASNGQNSNEAPVLAKSMTSMNTTQA